MNNFVSNNIVTKGSNESELSIVIITFKRVELLSLLLKSLQPALQTLSLEKPRIIFCINGPDWATKDYLEKQQQNLNFIFEIKQIESAVTPAEARNIATQDVFSDWVLFLDDDVEVPKDFFTNFYELKTRDPQVALWGGPNLTPQSSSYIQQKIGWILQSYLVTGPISYRYKLNNLEEIECQGLYFSLCNMFLKTNLFKSNLFNTSLKTAEENELIYKLALQNTKMKASDLLYVWHYRRSSIPHFLKQIENYGFGRGQLIYNGSVSRPVKIAALTALLVAMVFLINSPFVFIGMVFFWMSVIYLMLALKFKKNLVSDFFLPIRLWFKYSIGIVNGYISSYRLNK